MSKQEMQKISDDSRIQSAAGAVLDALRLGDGLTEELGEELKAALAEAAAAWRDKDYVPKSTANLFVDLVAGIESCAGAYEGDMSESIEALAQAVADLARDVTT